MVIRRFPGNWREDMVLKGVLFPIRWPTAAEACLTHYVTLDVAGQVLAIGEAGQVCQIGPHAWRALVAIWGTNPCTKRTDPAVFAHVEERLVSEPGYSLIPKTEFCGSLP
jgi:hypothetical protein